MWWSNVFQLHNRHQFSGRSSLKSRSKGLAVTVIYFHHKHSVSSSFLPVTDSVLRAEMCKEVVGRADGQTLVHIQLWYFFSSYKLPKTVTVTTLLLFGHVMLLCGKYIFIKLSEGRVQLSDCTIGKPYAKPAYPFTLVQFTNNAALILPPEAYQGRN